MNYYNNGYQPYQMYQTYPQMQQQYIPPQRPTGLQGEIVDSIEVVKAKNVDLSGNITYYPKADLSEIYTKQLCADGTSRILEYTLAKPSQAKPEAQPLDIGTLNSMLQQFKSEILSEMQSMIQKGDNQT